MCLAFEVLEKILSSEEHAIFGLGKNREQTGSWGKASLVLKERL
jgi:hypothetical protein